VNPILKDFILDLTRLRRMLALAETLSAFRCCALTAEVIEGNPDKDVIGKLQAAAKESHPDMPILNGVLTLYLAGRFENFVRELFEDLCDSVAGQCTYFSQLPKAMRENLIKFTAEVVSSPRKYGHAENGVIAFVGTLAENLNGYPLKGVNNKCLSITSENMWADTLQEIFGRIGANKVWERLGQQAPLQIFFHIDDPVKATSESRKVLNDFMVLRNKIAHPSGDLTWPSLDQALKYIDFCEKIATALSDICAVWATTLGDKLPVTEKVTEGENASSPVVISE